MKKLLSLTIMSVALMVVLVGCSDGNRSDELLPDIVAGGATFTKAELIDALWNQDAEASQDLNCVINSTFKITKATPFTIAKNANPSDYNEADVVIVSALTLGFDGTTADGRGAGCAEGALQYMVQASAEAPIDIETSTALRARHSLMHIVSSANSEYPGCPIRVHFDKAGRENCDDTLVDDDDEEADDEVEADDSADADDDEDDDGMIEITPIRPIGRFTFKAFRVSDDGVPCGPEDIKSVKLVVDDYNCQLQGYTPRPINE